MVIKKSRAFFERHRKLCYLADLIVMALGVFIFPLVFMDNFKGVILGFLIALLITRIFGMHWRPLRSIKES